ncbi:glycosyltransferase [Paenibacillus sp. FSL F4-0087]|uniref:glycosyltransferase n=1 Tax=Paenibacillus sp. FSL F4-0087 TaxID=2921368 RepID=UPI00096D05F9|nr:hypothetical protein BK122_03310 [Paenibacillus pabuli]
MSMEYIEQKLREIQIRRSELFKEMNIVNVTKHGNVSLTNNMLTFQRSFNDTKNMKIACIMDEFTFNSFEPECSLLQVTPDNWLREIQSFNPDLFFLESAWRGIDGLWNRKVPHLSNELIDLLSYCKKNKIPVVFWNKEDPVHFDTFLATAKYVDYVFTTDIDCIQQYKTLLNHNRVYLMPFAAQLKVHNPIELYDREDKYAFAGAYYKRYPERIKDLETFIDTITESKNLDIYDRNFYEDDPNYAFPTQYKKYIKGNLKPFEIDKAYKGYRFNINMNSVKQSQSMCARRVFELLASNTVTVSNYSRAIRNMLGDLVICTDDGKYLGDQIDKFTDMEYYNKYRLLGLRKILTEHTYTHRLEYLVNVVYQTKLELSRKGVALISKASTEQELQYVINQFKQQSYDFKELIVISDIKDSSLITEGIQVVESLNEDTANYIGNNFNYIAYLSSKDYYGKSYIEDMVLATKYTDCSVICKGAYFSNDDTNDIKKNNEGKQYRMVGSFDVKRALLRLDNYPNSKIIDFSESIEESRINEDCFSIDEYNYCENFNDDHCSVVDDLIINDQGIAMSQIYQKAEEIKPSKKSVNEISISSDDIFNQIHGSKQINLKKENDFIYVESKLKDTHEYIYLNKEYGTDKFNSNTNVYLDVDFMSKFSVDIVIVLLDNNRNKIESMVKPCCRKVSVQLNSNVKYMKFGLRFSGEGTCKIKKLIVGDINLDRGYFLNKSKVLLLADNYPDYQNLYRYAFIHSRLTEYKKNGYNVDMFKLNERDPAGYTEFGGIDVTSGYFEKFNNVARSGNYDTFLVHFLNETLWSGIQKFATSKRTIVWIHGAEIQPWWRREYNYTSQQQLDRAKIESEAKVLFWKKIFNGAINEEYNLHFVFVSDYFAEEVFEDLKIRLPEDKYSIIHNYINSDLFNYNEKGYEHRKKILSIRPFASNKYANDLTVKAIQSLSKKPVFKELQFTLIGKGELFHSTVKPIRKFKNVRLEERFLRQEEIAELHKEYGIFLIPTRWDSQGVSRDEAMSSGLVPITNNVAATSEFVDETCGMLVEAEDYEGLASNIEKLYNNPELFLDLSLKASERVARQSGLQTTIIQEIELISK